MSSTVIHSIYEARERGNTVTTGRERTSTKRQAPAINKDDSR